MKSIFPFILILLLLSGCQQTGGETAVSSPTAAPTATETIPATLLPPPAAGATLTAPPTSTPPAAAVSAPTTAAAAANSPGALIQVTMNGRVGVLLDEFPAAMRDRVAAALLAQPEETWRDRAARQIRLTRLRLNFRDFSYPDKGQLPLPQPDLWQIDLDPTGPQRQTIQGHDLVTLAYTFAATILTDADSPAAAEPALAEIGGVWEEPFVFPVDPDLLLQRTGNACVNEGGFPPNSYDSENVRHFYDFTCTADSGGPAGCHRTILPNFSCREALAAAVGEVETALRFERLPWDDELAAAVRTGPVTPAAAPDLQVVAADLAVNRIVYRYIEEDDCALEENAVGDSGWRRLLQFEATIHNVGGAPLHVGPVEAEDHEHNVFDYSPCHDHFHYSHYGEFFLADIPDINGSKQAFCVQSTDRLSNNETSPLTHDYSCSFQGVQSGWVDEYIAGLDTQWIDITDLDAPAEGVDAGLGFRSNGDRFLCEGTPVVDAAGEQLWEPTGFTTEEGDPVNRPQCTFIEEWDENNEAALTTAVPAEGSFVTAVCAQDEIGPRRNCGFTPLSISDVDESCRPGQTVSLPLRTAAAGAPQVVRVCERSAVLGTGVACTYADALANVIVRETETAVSFTCPLIRDGADGAGGFALYAAPVWPGDGPITIQTSP